jgi:hypothetical protein
MTRKHAYATPPWPSPKQVRDVLELGERAIEAHRAQAVQLARDVTLGAVTPRAIADETSAFYTRLSRDWADTLRILFRRTKDRND